MPKTVLLTKYRVTLIGLQPLIMHNDDIDWADLMDEWNHDKDNQKLRKAGDDRTPPHRWLGALYHNDAGQVIIPTANIMRVVMEGATSVLVPNGRGGKTFKAQSQSGIMPRELGWPLSVDGGKSILSYKDIEPLMEEPSFKKHRARAEELGFTLFQKRARVGMAKHIRVRPLFPKWQAGGELVVTDEQITQDALQDFFDIGGAYKGLCDWRPSSKTPGTYGMFEAFLERL